MGGIQGSIQELARPLGLEIRRGQDGRQTEAASVKNRTEAIKVGKVAQSVQWGDMGSVRNNLQGRLRASYDPHFQLTLFPVVVSALISAPRRSNTDVLWRPGREVRASGSTCRAAPAGPPGQDRPSAMQTRVEDWSAWTQGLWHWQARTGRGRFCEYAVG